MPSNDSSSKKPSRDPSYRGSRPTRREGQEKYDIRHFTFNDEETEMLEGLLGDWRVANAKVRGEIEADATDAIVSGRGFQDVATMMGFISKVRRPYNLSLSA